jgi:hypothetical protein
LPQTLALGQHWPLRQVWSLAQQTPLQTRALGQQAPAKHCWFVVQQVPLQT